MKSSFAAEAREKGIDTRFIEESFSRIRNIIRESVPSIAVPSF